MGTLDISFFSLFICFSLLIIPVFFSFFLKLKLTKDILFSVFRMTIQLALIGVFLQYLFKWNNPFINLGWLVIMISSAVFTTKKSVGIKSRFFLLPAFFSYTVSTLFVILFINVLVIRIENIWEGKYLVVVSGMLLGNVLRSNIIGINHFFSKISQETAQYHFVLSTGATRWEAMLPYMQDSLRAALKPTIATMCTMGLVALPGMMTGTILGGASPLIAIKYQIMIMIAIFTSTSISTFGTILLTTRKCFNDYDVLKLSVMNES